MGFTNRKYPIYEIAISTINRKNNPNERIRIGDIVVRRKPRKCIGYKEAKIFIWMLVQNFEEAIIPQLADENQENNIRFEKRRYMIPLSNLKKHFPFFDIQKAKDPNLIYQPFRLLDYDTFYFLNNRKPLDLNGLVFDKYKRIFI